MRPSPSSGCSKFMWMLPSPMCPNGTGRTPGISLSHAAEARRICMDEPTASLDAGAREALVRRLRQLKTEGVAMIGVFHHPGDVAGLIDAELDLSTKELEHVAQ